MMLFEPQRPSITIQTSKGNAIPFEHGLKVLPFDADKKLRALLANYPESQINRVRRQPNDSYNCHGMTFFCRRGWIIDDDAIDLVLRDDGFSEVSIDKVMVGDIALYMTRDGEVSHSGLVTRVDLGLPVVPFVLSKWGSSAEFLHRFNHCPYYTEYPHVKFMREFMKEN